MAYFTSVLWMRCNFVFMNRNIKSSFHEQNSILVWDSRYQRYEFKLVLNIIWSKYLANLCRWTRFIDSCSQNLSSTNEGFSYTIYVNNIWIESLNGFSRTTSEITGNTGSKNICSQAGVSLPNGKWRIMQLPFQRDLYKYQFLLFCYILTEKMVTFTTSFNLLF